MEKNNTKINLFASVMLIITALTVFITNRRIPFMMDDLWYSTVLTTAKPLEAFSDIVNAQVWHWHHWGGRSMTHGLLQLILMRGESFADVINTLSVFILSAVVMITSSTASGRIRRALLYILAGAGLILGLNANWKMSMFWEAGAANYLIISIFIMLFIFCYLRETPDKEKNEAVKKLPGIEIWMIPLAILAGWSNENMGPTCFIIAATVMIMLKRSGKKIPFWMFEGSLLSLAGSVMCIIAPGNFVRVETIEKRGMLWTLFLRCYSEMKAAFFYQILTLATLVFILILSIGILGIKLRTNEKILLLAAFLSWGAMFLSPHYPDRATFGTMVLMITVIISRSAIMIEQKKEALPPLFIGFTLIWLKGMYDLFEFISVSLGWIV